MQGLAVDKGSTQRVSSQNPVEEVPPVPAILKRALESLWEFAYRSSLEIPRVGFAEFEKELRRRLLQLGARMLEESLRIALGEGYRGSGDHCPKCGARGRFVNYRPRTITTLVQEVRLRRAYYHSARCGHGWIPLDDDLGLEGTSFSPGVRESICLLDAQVPFDQGRELLERLSAVRLDREEGRRLAEGKGSELEKQTLVEIENVCGRKKPRPRESPVAAKRLYLSPDGTTVPTMEGFKEVKIGAVFTTTTPKCGEEPERECTRYVGTMGNAQDLGRRLTVEALKMGLTGETDVVAIGDGAHWIWNEMGVILPENRVEIIDFYHASEKLWEVSRAVFGEENPKGKIWAGRWRRKLYDSDASGAISAMRRLRPKSKEARDAVRKAIHYYQGNRHRMRYREFRDRGYFIGSGVVEGGCKNLIGTRFKQGGMRWTKQGLQAMLQLRLAVFNHRWDYLWTARGARS